MARAPAAPLETPGEEDEAHISGAAASSASQEDSTGQTVLLLIQQIRQQVKQEEEMRVPAATRFVGSFQRLPALQVIDIREVARPAEGRLVADEIFA